MCDGGQGSSVSRRRSGRRSGITDLALSYPMAFTESLADSLGGAMGRGKLEGADILDLLGDSEAERVETVVAMLRRSSEDEINEFMRIGQTAVLQVSQERAGQAAGRVPENKEEEEEDDDGDDRRRRSRRPRRRSSYWLL